MSDWLTALILGLVEGLTEFIPVSSTGHITLLGHFLGFESPGNSFFILIQLGAVLAVLTVYFGRLWTLATQAPSDPAARRFIVGVLLAFLPAVVAGLALGDLITEVLLETPVLICVMLIVGGVVLLAVDRIKTPPRHTDVTRYPLRTAFLIGLSQCLALVPGVSRSGATIAGALLLGCDKRSAAEFSFFLAMPTMAGAFAYSLYKSYDQLTADDLGLIAIGFGTSFVAGVIVVRGLLDFVGRHGFAPFAYWRIGVGLTGLALLGMGVGG
jgi:undecaprenyl-diphosphatase